MSKFINWTKNNGALAFMLFCQIIALVGVTVYFIIQTIQGN